MSAFTWAEDEFSEVEPGVWQCDFLTGMGDIKIEVNFKGMCVTLLPPRSAHRTYPLDVIDGRVCCEKALPAREWSREWAKLNDHYTEWLAGIVLL